MRPPSGRSLTAVPAGMVSIYPGEVAAFAPDAKYDVLPIMRSVAEFFGSDLLQRLPKAGSSGLSVPPSSPSAGARPGKFGLDLRVRVPEGTPGRP